MKSDMNLVQVSLSSEPVPLRHREVARQPHQAGEGRPEGYLEGVGGLNVVGETTAWFSARQCRQGDPAVLIEDLSDTLVNTSSPNSPSLGYPPERPESLDSLSRLPHRALHLQSGENSQASILDDTREDL
jgi:hypothetical protein